ncbi:hypothetical protein ACQ4PT_040259 [Festuca glaucescens]
MEITIMSFAAVAIVVLLCRFVRPNKTLSKDKELLPGPWNLPILGSLHHVFSNSMPPHRRLAELSRQHGPVMFLKLGEVPTVVVSSSEAAEVVMKSKDLAFAPRPRSVTLDVIGYDCGVGVIFAPYGDRWQQARKVCIVELLSAKQVRRMEGIRAEEVGNLLRSVSVSVSVAANVNLTEKVSALTNDIIARAVFGGKCARARQCEYLGELEKITALLGGFSLVDLFPSSRLVRLLSSGERQMRRSYGRIQSIIGDIIEQRRQEQELMVHDEEDLLDVLLRLHQEDSLAFPTSEATGGSSMTCSQVLPKPLE